MKYQYINHGRKYTVDGLTMVRLIARQYSKGHVPKNPQLIENWLATGHLSEPLILGKAIIKEAV